jgi:hypothetical protein
MSNNQNDQEYPYGYGLSRTSLAKLYMNKANVMKWSFGLSISWFIVLGIWFFLIRDLLKINFYPFLDYYVLALAFFIWGYLGLFWAYRRQVPQVVMVKGKPAFIIGMFMMIGCWSLSIYSLIIGSRIMIENMMK